MNMVRGGYWRNFRRQTAKGKDWPIHLKKIREKGSTDQRHESGRPKHADTEKNVTAVDEPVGPCTKPERPDTNTPDIQSRV